MKDFHQRSDEEVKGNPEAAEMKRLHTFRLYRGLEASA